MTANAPIIRQRRTVGSNTPPPRSTVPVTLKPSRPTSTRATSAASTPNTASTPPRHGSAPAFAPDTLRIYAVRFAR